MWIVVAVMLVLVLVAVGIIQRPAGRSQAELDAVEKQAGAEHHTGVERASVDAGHPRLQRWLLDSSQHLEWLTWWLVGLTAVLAVVTRALISFAIRLLPGMHVVSC